MALARQTLCLLVVVFLHITYGKVVDLPGLGPIDGTTTLSQWAQRTIYQYKGIHFAMPPVDDLRFARPIKWTEPSWTEVRNHKDFGPSCPQSLNYSVPIPEWPFPKDGKNWQEEDCLFLNVFTPKTENGGIGTGLPVMVFIHGGAFLTGSSQGFTPEYLLDKDVLLVTPQYRLGALGFLSMLNEEIPGNFGMLDVILALEWVRDNIHAFGGDPSRVTLFGQSAGAATVSLMLFSPLVEDGLIQRVIAQSGSGVGAWVVDTEPVEHAMEIADFAGCNDTLTDVEMVECLRSKTARQIINAHSMYLAKDVLTGGRVNGGYNIVWNEAGNQSFLPKDPSLMLEEGKFKILPLMSGANKHEGSGFLALYYDLILNPLNLLEDVDYMTHSITRQALEYVGIVDRSGYVPTYMQDQYFLDSEVGDFNAMCPGLIDMMGMGLLKASTFLMAKEMARRGGDSWMYAFNFFGRHSLESPDRYPFEQGIAHSDEMYYIFPRGKTLDASEDAMSQIMVQLWTNFAINGVPTAEGVDWPKISTAEGPYLKIDSVVKPYDSYVQEEYMIAVREGMVQPKSSVTAIHASVVTIVLALSVLLW